MPRNRWRVNISQTDLFMPDVSFIFKHAQLRAHCRVCRAVHLRKYFSDRTTAQAVEDVHDLPFAAR